MVANRNAWRQFRRDSLDKAPVFIDLRVLLLGGVYLLVTPFLGGCAGRASVDDDTPETIAACAEVKRFFQSSASGGSDISLLKKQTDELVTKISSTLKGPGLGNCADRDKFERLIHLLDLRQDTKLLGEKAEASIIEKSESFPWRLPGEKNSATKATYVKRLSFQNERSKRESLFKLFSNSRSRRWNDWGFRELVKLRNREALEANRGNYLEFYLRRQGQDFDAVSHAAELIRKKLRGPILGWLSSTAAVNGVSPLEAWDLPWILERAWDGPPLAPAKGLGPLVFIDFAKQYLTSVGITVSSAINAPGIIDPPFLKSDFGSLVGKLALDDYLNESKRTVAIFQVPSPASQEAVYQAFRRLAMESPLLATTLQKFGDPGRRLVGMKALALNAYYWAALFEFESEIYRKPDSDPFELWAGVQKEYWGIDSAPFYSSWDEDLFLRSPGATGEKALGCLIAAGMIDSVYKQFGNPPTAALGAKLKAEWFPLGSEVSTFGLLNRFSQREWSLADLVELLSNE